MSSRQTFTIPKAADKPYRGLIRVQVDARDVTRGIFKVRMSLPAKPGAMVFLYPEWLPGYHAPKGPIENVAGLEFWAGDVRLDWYRHPVNVYAFRVVVPADANRLEIRFQYLSPTHGDQGRVSVSDKMLTLAWHMVLLYPAGHYARRIRVAASLKLPPRWHFASALNWKVTKNGSVRFGPISVEELVDCPLLAGQYIRNLTLDAGKVRLHLTADKSRALRAKPSQIAAHRRLIAQADVLFGARPFKNFSFLCALSDKLSGFAVEHRRCCEITTVSSYFTRWNAVRSVRDLFAHEYVHAWNGKARMGKSSWIPSYEHPIQNDLLWLYEGLTTYWSHVLCARAALWSLPDVLGYLAQMAALSQIRQGRQWRPMRDTTRDPVIEGKQEQPWPSWQLGDNYYFDGELMWLEADVIIRDLSQGRRSLDDFARTFFSAGKGAVARYSFETIIRALNAVQRFDWPAFFKDRLNLCPANIFLGGVVRGGYKLSWRDRPNHYARNLDAFQETIDMRFSKGLLLEKGGRVKEVIWNSPAFEARITAGSQIAMINGVAWSESAAKEALLNQQRLTLKLKAKGSYVLARIAGGSGPRYPHLTPHGTSRALDRIYAP